MNKQQAAEALAYALEVADDERATDEHVGKAFRARANTIRALQSVIAAGDQTAQPAMRNAGELIVEELAKDPAFMQVHFQAALNDITVAHSVLTDILAALRSPGMVTVPMEPTREMWAASGDAQFRELKVLNFHHDSVTRVVWDAMIAARPKVSGTPGGSWGPSDGNALSPEMQHAEAILDFDFDAQGCDYLPLNRQQVATLKAAIHSRIEPTEEMGKAGVLAGAKSTFEADRIFEAMIAAWAKGDK